MIGPSGCGKTTTLRMIAGLVEPTEGRIEVHGRDVTQLRAHKRPVNTVFQQYALFPHLNVFENVAFGLRERRTAANEIQRRVGEMLELVDLAGRERDRPSKLSGGQQQRVALARSLMLRPEVLLLDEPLGALDLKLRKELQLQLKRIQHEVGITFVYVTHDQEEAFFMSDRVAIMRAGRIEQLGTPPDVYERPATEFVAEFVGASNRLPGKILAHLDDGSYEAEVAGIGRIRSSGVPDLPVDQSVVAIVRPEAISPSSIQRRSRRLDRARARPGLPGASDLVLGSGRRGRAADDERPAVPGTRPGRPDLRAQLAAGCDVAAVPRRCGRSRGDLAHAWGRRTHERLVPSEDHRPEHRGAAITEPAGGHDPVHFAQLAIGERHDDLVAGER